MRKTAVFFIPVLFSLLTTVAPVLAAPHKIQVSDPAAAQRILAKGGRLLADYGSYQLYSVQTIGTELADAVQTEVRDDYDHIELNAGMITTTEPATMALQKRVGAFKGSHTHLVQFIGPVQPAWRAALEETGVRIVCYIPQNAYLVFGNADGLARLQNLAAAADYIQWENIYTAANKIHPGARLTAANGQPREIGTDLFEIQLVADDEMNPDTLALIDSLKLAPIHRQSKRLDYVNVVASLDPASLNQIAAQPDVVSVLPYFVRKKFCERQDQIVAGNLSGNSPTGPGYLAWLTSKGFTQAQFDAANFAVDVSDSGVDNGTTSPNHFGLYVSGLKTGTSRVIYSRLEGTPNKGSTTQGLDGHGNLNAHIIAGYNDLTGFPHADTSGYHFGLGVCPFVRVGSSIIFDPDLFTNPSYEDLQSMAYRDGARLSANSWGASTAGAYDSDSQRYDALVRDAQPAGSAVPNAGNQEMVIVFAAGNDGSGTQTVGAPGTAKNVITVGAGENVQPFGGSDGSGVSDTGADSANDIISFSSRGPCSDGRKKPDLCAPGTHVSGGVAQTASPGSNGTAIAGFTGSGVSGGPGGSLFWPTNQQFYTASSGTSHSTPGVAGGCAMLRQYFINQGWNAPSPAMTKAFLMNAARYMTGVSANDTLWSNNQGMGELNLGAAFDGTPRFLRDELTNDLFTASGQTRVFAGRVADTGTPLRITLAWTDAPGSTTGNAYNNDLNLTVDVAGKSYKGNVFSGAFSATGGVSDVKNNVESVIIPAGVSGVYTVTVTAANINSDGVPNYGTSLDQDFALVIYNAAPLDDLTVTPANWLSFSGYQGGPFSSSNNVYTLTNTGVSNVTWSASWSAQWLDVLPANGTLPAGGTTNVTVSLTAQAALLAPGTNTDTVVFSNQTSGASQSRSVQLTVNPRLLDHFVWDPIPATQYIGLPFPVTITAQDGGNSTFVGFTNTIALNALNSSAVQLNILNGTNTWNYPMATLYHDARTQVIYLSSELGGTNQFTGLSLYVSTIPGQTMNAWTIRMKHTAQADYTASRLWETNGWTVVFQTNLTIAATGWINFAFTTPFTYNGTSNLFIDFSFNDASYTTDGYCRSTAVATRRSLYYRTDSGFGDPLTWSGTTPSGTRGTSVPTIRLMAGGTPVAITPTNTGNFISGIWTGSVAVLETASNIFLRADDGSGHSATSGVFTVQSLTLDTDHDGLPDWWEQLYFGDPVSADPAGICSNGINTVLEAYIAGFNPVDPQSSFLTSILFPPPSGKEINWNAVSGRIYSVYGTTNLLTGFQCLQSNILWPQSNYLDGTDFPNSYYKIDVRLKP